MSDAKKGHLKKKEEEASGKHEAHVRKLDQGYHVTKVQPDGSETEHAAADQDEAMQHVQGHFDEAEALQSADPAQAGAPQPVPQQP